MLPRFLARLSAAALSIPTMILLQPQTHTQAQSLPAPDKSMLTDHLSGQKFELRREIPSAAATSMSTLGCNTRCMLGWCWISIARAYAFAFYVDDSAVLWGKARRNTDGAAPTIAEVLDAKQRHPEDFEIAIVLKMAREIAGEHLAHGFKNSVLSRLPTPTSLKVDRSGALATGRAAAGLEPATTTGSSNILPASDEPAIAQLSRFISTFSGLKFAAGEEITFVWAKDGRMYTAFKGELVNSSKSNATLTDPNVIRALFDVYVGEKQPVSQTALNTVKANWQTVLDSPAVITAPPVAAMTASNPAAAATEETDMDIFDRAKLFVERMKLRLEEKQQKDGLKVPALSEPALPRVDPAVIAEIVELEHKSRRA